MQQSKCTIRTHCCRAQQTHKSQQRFPVNKKCTHTHTLYAHISVQKYPSKAAYTRTIIDHHYASFKFYANHISWSFAKKGKKRETNKPRKNGTNNSPSTYKAHWVWRMCWPPPLAKHCGHGKWPSGCDAVNSESEIENCAPTHHQTQPSWVAVPLPGTYDTNPIQQIQSTEEFKFTKQSSILPHLTG